MTQSEEYLEEFKRQASLLYFKIKVYLKNITPLQTYVYYKYNSYKKIKEDDPIRIKVEENEMRFDEILRDLAIFQNHILDNLDYKDRKIIRMNNIFNKSIERIIETSNIRMGEEDIKKGINTFVFNITLKRKLEAFINKYNNYIKDNKNENNIEKEQGKNIESS